MKILRLRTIMLIFFLSSINLNTGCTGKNDDGLSALTPTNLVVLAELVGASPQQPHGDGSGKVNFIISATNATSFNIAFGNGETRTITSGNLTYTYVSSFGINSFEVHVSAHNSGNFISTALTITIYIAPKLVWSDEFNIDGPPSSANWNFEIGTGIWGWGNNESQYYTSRPENVIIENGVLKIRALRESFRGSSFTSARITTMGKFSFRYGRIEFRAKLPYGGGTWPALWMLGANFATVGWPACGEIDVMEHRGNHLNIIHGTLHHPGNFGGNAVGGSTRINNATTEFNIYAAEWCEEFINFYVNDNLYFSFKNNPGLPFNHNHFIIINCAMGGNFGGNIDPNFVSSNFEIDYVRVYQ